MTRRCWRLTWPTTWLQRGVPFREAHHAAGHAVKRAHELGVNLTELPLAEWQAIHPAFGADLYQVFDPERAVARRSAFGGTAPEAVREQLDLAKQVIESQSEIRSIRRGET